MGNLRKVPAPITNAKLKFANQNNNTDDANGTNKPIKVSSSISEKIRKLSSSASSSEIVESSTASNTNAATANTAQKNAPVTSGKSEKKPQSPAEKTNVSKPVGAKANGNLLSGNISTYITTEVSATATIKTITQPKSETNGSESPEKKIVKIESSDAVSLKPDETNATSKSQVESLDNATIAGITTPKSGLDTSKPKTNKTANNIPEVVILSKEKAENHPAKAADFEAEKHASLDDKNNTVISKELDGKRLSVFIRCEFFFCPPFSSDKCSLIIF